MAPDLPYVRQDVPDDSEAPKVGGRFARLARSRGLLAKPPASKGITAYLPAVYAARNRTLRSAVVVAVASALSLALLGPQASADELTSQRARVKQEIAKTKSELNESTKTLSAAVVAVDKAQNKLDAATARLTTTRQELRVAQTKDAHMATRLQQVRADLAAAVAAVVAGQARLDAQHAKAGQVVRDQYQQQTNLLPIALLVDPDSSEDLQTRLQWSTTLFDSAQAEIDRLTELQRQLDAARARQAELEAKVAAARREAAANLKIKKKLEARAEAQEATVAQLLTQQKTAEDAAAADVAQDKARYTELIKERASVERRIAGRIAKAAAERRRAAERAAAERKRTAERKSCSSITIRHKAQQPGQYSTLQHVERRPRLRLPGAGSHHLTFRNALPPRAALLEVARWYGFRCRMRHSDPGSPGRPGRRAVLQRRLWQPADDRPRLPRRSVRDHWLQPRKSLHSSRWSTCPERSGHWLRWQHRILHWLPPSPDGLAERSAPEPDDVVLILPPPERSGGNQKRGG